MEVHVLQVPDLQISFNSCCFCVIKLCAKLTQHKIGMKKKTCESKKDRVKAKKTEKRSYLEPKENESVFLAGQLQE